MNSSDEHESPAARRHRFARAIRSAPAADAAAGLLEAFEIIVTTEAHDRIELLTGPAGALDPDAVDVDLTDITELAEVEALPDWSYVTLLSHAIRRRPAPSFQFEGEAHPRTMRADDLLSCRKYQLAGLLAQCTEQAWNLGDAKTVTAMVHLTQMAVRQCIGEAALRVGLGAGDENVGDA